MAVTTKTFDQLVQEQATAIQAKVGGSIDLTIGSILRALVESNAALGLWQEANILHILTLARASTSVGADLDSWVADFGVTRVAGTRATGDVTVGRYVSTSKASVPVGSQIETEDGSRTFEVIADTARPTYNVATSSYELAIGTASIAVPVRDLETGTGGNVAAGALTRLTTPIQYIDTVTNALAFTTGIDAETDAALRERFVAYIQSLARATAGAIGFAVGTVEGVKSYSLVENQQVLGGTDYGFFYVVVDDGTGSPSSTLLDTVYAAIDAYRPVGSRFTVVGPTLQAVNVSATLTVAAGYVKSDVAAAAKAAVTAHLASLELGATLYYTKLAQVIYDSSPGIVNVTSLLAAAGTADVTPANPRTVIRPGTIGISAP